MVFLGREITEQRNYSEKVAVQIDEEVYELIQCAHEVAQKILADGKQRLKLIAEKLILVETIDDGGFEELMKQPLPPPLELEIAPAS
jgi:cell division protease FtsH